MLMLDDQTRAELWPRVVETIEKYLTEIGTARPAPELDVEGIRENLRACDFRQPMSAVEAVDFVSGQMWQHLVHNGHPRFFGLFNPAATTMGIVADALVAAFNPQLAAWGHSPFPIEVENHLIRSFGERFGYDSAKTDGTFCSGGSEANHTALLTALNNAFPEFNELGLRVVSSQPVFYISSQGHHSFLKAAKMSGIGTAAVREIPVGEDLRMNLNSLTERIAADKSEGLKPLMIVGTAGTTSAGIVDPLIELAEISEREKLWFHVDAAWGGGAAFVPGLRQKALNGIQRADSITFDAHKWLSAPMGAGVYLTQHTEILERTFGVATGYMPRDAAGLDVIDPYTHSIQWSRRFIGLKVFMSLLVAGWDGYAEVIGKQIELGDRLRQRLAESGWRVINPTPLPVICFVDEQNASPEFIETVVNSIVRSGEAWISVARIGQQAEPVIRAGITSYRTTENEVDALVDSLNRARQEVLENQL